MRQGELEDLIEGLAERVRQGIGILGDLGQLTRGVLRLAERIARAVHQEGRQFFEPNIAERLHVRVFIQDELTGGAKEIAEGLHLAALIFAAPQIEYGKEIGFSAARYGSRA